MPEYEYQKAPTGHFSAAQGPVKPVDGPSGNGAGKRRWDELSRAQRAGIRCGEGAFRTFFMERYPGWVCQEIGGGMDVPATLRRFCGVDSRRELDTDETARALFDRLDSEYLAWMSAP